MVALQQMLVRDFQKGWKETALWDTFRAEEADTVQTGTEGNTGLFYYSCSAGVCVCVCVCMCR